MITACELIYSTCKSPPKPSVAIHDWETRESHFLPSYHTRDHTRDDREGDLYEPGYDPGYDPSSSPHFISELPISSFAAPPGTHALPPRRSRIDRRIATRGLREEGHSHARRKSKMLTARHAARACPVPSYSADRTCAILPIMTTRSEATSSAVGCTGRMCTGYRRGSGRRLDGRPPTTVR